MSLLSQMKKVDADKAGFHELTEEEKKKVQGILLSSLRDIYEYCRSENIEWSLSGGSILGAVRHMGFIPWDDDADIFMTRDNFEKLKRGFNKALSEKYELKVPGDPGYLMHYPQIYIKNTIAQLIQSTNQTEDRLFIDIFILESTYTNSLLRFLHGLICTALLFIDSALRVDMCSENLLKCDDGSENMIKEVNKRRIIAKLFKWKPLEKWLKLSDRVFSIKKKPDKLVVCPSGAKHFFGEIFERNKMCNLKEVPFEGINVFIPKDYDYYLKIRYGSDYMTPPTNHEKERHVYVKFKLND